jgi:hypothetical protein
MFAAHSVRRTRGMNSSCGARAQCSERERANAPASDACERSTGPLRYVSVTARVERHSHILLATLPTCMSIHNSAAAHKLFGHPSHLPPLHRGAVRGERVGAVEFQPACCLRDKSRARGGGHMC